MAGVESIRSDQQAEYNVQRRSFLIEPDNSGQTLENVDRIAALLENLELKKGFTETAEMGYVLIMREVRHELRSVYDPDAQTPK